MNLKGMLLVVFALLCGCVKTSLDRSPLPQTSFELAALNSRPLVVEVYDLRSNSGLGHQYALFVVPAGSVEAKNLASFVERSLYERLVLAGYKPVSPQSPLAISAPKLRAEITMAQASAFDFFFMRKVKAMIRIAVRLERPNATPQAYALSGEFSEFKRYGFKAQLEHALSKALAQALDQLFQVLK
jgi:hypothetical protein